MPGAIEPGQHSLHDEPSPWSEALRARGSRSLEHVFTLLGLVLSRRPLRLALRALRTGDLILRGTALEYLESVLPPAVRECLWPFLEDDRARPRSVGLVYEATVAFGISMGDNLFPLSPEPPLVAVSWLCVWIVLFPLVVPAGLRRSMAASFASASTWPVSFFLGLRLGNPAPSAPVVLLNFLENYIAAIGALVPTLIMRRLGRQVQTAREMGSYELVERLDQGGMGEVWRARHRMLARPAAIKLIRADMLGMEKGALADSVVRRFEREAQATASLHSPHTIELYDFGITADGTFYYVMELLEGLDLEGLVRRFGPIPAERAVQLLLQACDSLTDAHHAGLIHRDVKPANIYACKKGLKYDFVKVLDFGLVKSAWRHEQEGDSRLTREGAVAGTPAFMAPEAILQSGEVDARLDLYGLGCVGYWLLTGETVFAGSSPMQIALHHVRTPPSPPSKRTEIEVPEALDRIILSCLEKEPEKRPVSAEALARELLGCPVDGGWTQERARRWWEAHLPAAPAPCGPESETSTFA